MCGIVGLCKKGYFLDRDIQFIKKANDIASYRGPDDEGYLFSDSLSNKVIHSKQVDNSILHKSNEFNIALAHKRLSIIDISESGHQPMASHDNKIWIIFNGEIFNYIELKNELLELGHEFRTHSDTEVIIYAYLEWGEDCVNRFNGMWAFAILDLNKKLLFCSRDRYGVKPFHYFFDGRKFIFSSEIKQILEDKEIKRKANDSIIYDFLSFGSIDHCNNTFFEDIYNLLPGYNLVFDLTNFSLNTHKYYNPQLSINYNITRKESENRFRELIIDSVRLRLRSDVSIGSCLSGGLDSSSIVCIVNNLLKKQNSSELQVTLSSHFEEKEANEKEYMDEVTQKLKVKSYFIYPEVNELLEEIDRLIWHQEEPFGSTSIYAQWSVFKLAKKQNIKVMLDGQGADEQLAGYVGYYHTYINELKNKGFKKQYLKEKFLYEYRHRKLFERFKKSANSDYLSANLLNDNLIKEYKEKSHHLNNISQNYFDSSEQLNNILYDHTMRSNLQQLLHYEDRNSMAFSVEGRIPFLDYRLVEFIFSLPSHSKINNGYTKFVLRKSMNGILPKKIQWRVNKLGFATPEKKWQTLFLQHLVEDALNSNELNHFISITKAKEWWKMYQQDSANISFIPWRWVSLYQWIKQFNVTVGN